MRYIVLMFVLGLVFVGCSDTYYLNKVYKRGLLDSTVTVTTDTIKETKTDTFYKGITIQQNVTYDTLFCDSNNTVQSTSGSFETEDGRLTTKGERQDDGSVVIRSECEEVRDSVAVLVNHNTELIVNNEKVVALNSKLQSELEDYNKDVSRWKWYFIVSVIINVLLAVLILKK